MHIMSEGFLDVVCGEKPFDGEEKVQKSIPVINLHPALPGAFDGAHAIERAYEAFQKGEIAHTGAMVHRVVKEVDRGEPVVVQQVEIKEGEPIEAFEERLHKTEWEIIVKGAAKVLDEVAPIQVSCPATVCQLLNRLNVCLVIVSSAQDVSWTFSLDTSHRLNQ